MRHKRKISRSNDLIGMSLELLPPATRARVNYPMNHWPTTSNETWRDRTSPTRTSSSGTRIQVVFTAIGSCAITGSYSRKVYFFSSAQPEQSVDAEDVPELLDSGIFRLAIRA